MVQEPAVSFKQLMIVKITVCSSSVPQGTPSGTLNVINAICKCFLWRLFSVWGNLVSQPVGTSERSDESAPNCGEGRSNPRPPFLAWAYMTAFDGKGESFD